eukprot:CAMPEP_0113300444 /NCGR_PEP_ID=MMETSP0010_2-20120614/2073_1 /TAXON_ID=216773 ORGANISM="Corethron hystrix, Strain 308" /NCGR_SAMPLE_ID=MMETSP0010_2 /ASSEMBLY_ACC=CAM_ASM_000155 /LENGTH=334 /DNA_ID=CAMNT_0000153873 /DNA_START=8 /DNA_END=1012 /DNA_ORIENTATION=+ /assembly_acc=CAM_ASM_000155
MSWPPPEVGSPESLNVDTSRGRMLLRVENANQIPTGVTILQKTQVETREETVDSKSIIDITAENEMLAQNLKTGGNKIDITTTHVTMTGETDIMGQMSSIRYDSKYSDVVPEGFESLAKIIGQSNTIETDKDGNVVSASQHEQLLKAMSGQDSEDIVTNEEEDPLLETQEEKESLSEHQIQQIDQMMRATQVLPDDPVKPGDDWDFVMDIKNKFGGSAVLLGYVEYDGSDCAVIQLDGKLHITQNQLEQIGDAVTEEMEDDFMKQEMQEVFEEIQISYGKLSGVVYWDHAYKFARYTRIEMTMDMLLPNAFDPEGEKMDILTEETMIMYSSIKE